MVKRFHVKSRGFIFSPFHMCARSNVASLLAERCKHRANKYEPFFILQINNHICWLSTRWKAVKMFLFKAGLHAAIGRLCVFTMWKSTHRDPKTSLRFHTGDEVRLLLSGESLQMATPVGQAEKPRCLGLKLRPPSGASWQAPVHCWQARDVLHIIVWKNTAAQVQFCQNSNFWHLWWSQWCYFQIHKTGLVLQRVYWLGLILDVHLGRVHLEVKSMEA